MPHTGAAARSPACLFRVKTLVTLASIKGGREIDDKSREIEYFSVHLKVVYFKDNLHFSVNTRLFQGGKVHLGYFHLGQCYYGTR